MAQASRRSILKGAITLPTLALPVGLATVTLAALWEKRKELLAGYTRADKLADEAYARFMSACPARPREAYVNSFFYMRGPNLEWFTEKDSNGVLRKYGLAEQWRQVEHHLKNKQDHVAADLAGKRADTVAVYQDAIRQLRVNTGFAAADAEQERAWEALDAIEDQIITAPAKSVQDLAIKASVARRQDYSDYEENGSKASIALLSDIERLNLAHL